MRPGVVAVDTISDADCWKPCECLSNNWVFGVKRAKVYFEKRGKIIFFKSFVYKELGDFVLFFFIIFRIERAK